MYTNIPKVEIINIVNNIIHNIQGIETNLQKEIIHILETIMEQNYFHFNQEYYKQIDGLAMGAPTSSILAEIYVQNMERTKIYPILIKQQIIAYFRYVDDILIIYDQKKTDINYTLDEFNKLQPTIQFKIEKEKQRTINSLDIEIYRNDKNIQFSIYRKPTKTDTIIRNSSCHPHEHKMSSINYLINRTHTYPMTRIANETEKNTIKKYCIIMNMIRV
jgi:hypothetical protein